MFKKIKEGNVFFTDRDDLVACGPRACVLPDGKICCSFNVQTCIGSNDFFPMLSYSDDGENWSEPKAIWEDIKGKKSINISVRENAGKISVAGICMNIDKPGESFWSDEVGGMKENCMVYALSDDGYTFPAPKEVYPAFYSACEQPGGMLTEEDGTLTMVYSPYKTIEQRGVVDTKRMVVMRSHDGGETFDATVIGEVENECCYAEAWIVKLDNGKLLVSTWQTCDAEHPDQFLISSDNGKTFTKPMPMPFKGQTTSLTPVKDGKVLIPYNQRKEKPAGVRLAYAKPDENGFNLIADELIWTAEDSTRNNTTGDFDQWTDYSFGEPHVCVLPDGKLMLTLWYEQGKDKGIKYVILDAEL